MEYLNLNKLLKIDATKNLETKFNLKKMRKFELKKLLKKLKLSSNNKKLKKLKLKVRIVFPKQQMLNKEKQWKKHIHKCL